MGMKVLVLTSGFEKFTIFSFLSCSFTLPSLSPIKIWFPAPTWQISVIVFSPIGIEVNFDII